MFPIWFSLSLDPDGFGYCPCLQVDPFFLWVHKGNGDITTLSSEAPDFYNCHIKQWLLHKIHKKLRNGSQKRHCIAQYLKLESKED